MPGPFPISEPQPQKLSRDTIVLFIDDNQDDLDAWSIGLRNCGYLVLKASTGVAGLDLFRYQGVDCVVLDLAMSPQSGLDTLLKLVPERDHPKVPVVVLTHLRNARILNLARDYGAMACLNKQSTSVHVLDETIKDAIARVSASTS